MLRNNILFIDFFNIVYPWHWIFDNIGVVQGMKILKNLLHQNFSVSSTAWYHQ